MCNLFERLPPEILLKIFQYELLVPYHKIERGQREVTHSQGITIIDGKAEHPYPNSLFKVDRRTSWLARTYTFSQNRFILGGVPESSVAWLASQPRDLTKLIRRLDLLVLPNQFYDSERLNGLPQLLAVLDDHLELRSLCLSIDAVRICGELDEHLDHDWFKAVYCKLLQIFQDEQEVRKVNDFFVHYPQYESEELKLEKSIKGRNYDSIARGKEKLRTRDTRLIHGWEYGMLYETGGRWTLCSDYEDYSFEDIAYDGWFMEAHEERDRQRKQRAVEKQNTS